MNIFAWLLSPVAEPARTLDEGETAAAARRCERCQRFSCRCPHAADALPMAAGDDWPEPGVDELIC